MSNLISSFFIDSSEISQNGGDRSYVINGDIGSSFKLQVIKESTSGNKYFNYKIIKWIWIKVDAISSGYWPCIS